MNRPPPAIGSPILPLHGRPSCAAASCSRDWPSTRTGDQRAVRRVPRCLAVASQAPGELPPALDRWQTAAGREDHPVVYVDLDDARAYARWAGKRLPTEEEWQYAAQGPDGRIYPWGDEMLPDRCNDGAIRRHLDRISMT